MEQLSKIDELTPEQRVGRFVNFLELVIGVDDLFPPDSGVRELAQKPTDLGPRAGEVALMLVWDNPEPINLGCLELVRD
jgi:hypothetical protein